MTETSGQLDTINDVIIAQAAKEIDALKRQHDEDTAFLAFSRDTTARLYSKLRSNAIKHAEDCMALTNKLTKAEAVCKALLRVPPPADGRYQECNNALACWRKGKP